MPRSAKGSDSRSKSSRVLIIGLDGATFSILDPLVQNGTMPNLAAFMARGHRATLMSTEPYVTAPAWTSLATGKRPDSHGVFDWSTPVEGSYSRIMVNSAFRRDLAFWEILSQRGIPAGTLNLPLTYPPSRAASFSVAGMFAPSQSADYTFPPDLKVDLEALRYRIDIRKSDYFDRGFLPFLKDLTHMTRSRGRGIRYCLRTFPWRAAIAVFVGPDRLQHPFWHFLSSCSSSEESRKAAEYFRVLDSELGKIFKVVGRDTHIYIVSDHGFGPHRHAFYINEWLEKEGFLVLEEGSSCRSDFTSGLKDRLRRAAQFSQNRLSSHRLPIGSTLLSRVKERLNRAGPFSSSGFGADWNEVDWDRTTAFADTPHGVRLNVSGREVRGSVSPDDYESVRNELGNRLARVLDPISGAPVHSEVLPRESRYWEERTNLAPDLVYTFTDNGSTWRIGRLSELRFGKRMGGSFLVNDTEWERGTHRPEGILIAAGPEIRTGATEEEYHLWDIVPTLLYHLDQAIPPDLDGMIMRGLFRPEVLEQRQEHWGNEPARRDIRNRNGTGQSQQNVGWDSLEEEKSVAEHLKALGYFS